MNMVAVQLETPIVLEVFLTDTDPKDRRSTLRTFLRELRTEVNGSTVEFVEYGLVASDGSRLLKLQARRAAWRNKWWKIDLRVVSTDEWADEKDGKVRFIGTHAYGPADAQERVSDGLDAGKRIGGRLADGLTTVIPNVEGVSDKPPRRN